MTNANSDRDRTTRAQSASIPFPPMRLSRGAQVALIGLRMLICLTTVMAIITIMHAPAP
jgi:hypothetical protein